MLVTDRITKDTLGSWGSSCLRHQISVVFSCSTWSQTRSLSGEKGIKTSNLIISFYRRGRVILVRRTEWWDDETEIECYPSLNSERMSSGESTTSVTLIQRTIKAEDICLCTDSPCVYLLNCNWISFTLKVSCQARIFRDFESIEWKYCVDLYSETKATGGG